MRPRVGPRGTGIHRGKLMQILSAVRARVSRHLWMAFALVCLGMVWSTSALAVGLPSTYAGCANRTLTVAWGGSGVVDLSACHFFGLGPISTPGTHGTVSHVGSPAHSVSYAHNGSTPPGGGSDTFVVLDDNSDFITVAVTIQAPTSAINVAPTALPTMTAGTAFSQTLTATGGTAPYTYSLASGTLPPGLTLASSGVISGTPTQRGGYSFSVNVVDSTSASAARAYSGTVQNPSLALVPASATAIQGAPFNLALSTAGGVAPHTYLLETGAFPAGISVSSGGVISGTTSAAPGNYPVTLRVTDASTGPGAYFELEPFTLTVSPPPSVSIAVAPASVSEDGATNLVYTVTRSLNLSSPTVVNITTGGTATAGTDFTGGVPTVTIPSGATTATITIDPTVDATVEANETVTLTVAAGTGYTVGAPASATGTILNDDVPSASISVSPASVSEDGAANQVYTVTLNQASLSAVSINYTVGGTATNGTDYATIASPLVIAAGATTGTITVNPTTDATIEANETVILTLAAGAGYTVGVPNSATGTILNDDLPSLTVTDVTATEGNAGTTNFAFTVALSAPAGPGGVTFDIATANGTATAGVDYVAQSLTGQTIPAGSSTYTFTVQVNGDALNEPNETFFVNVTNVTGATVTDGQGVGTITNDDPQPSLSINDVTVTEGNAGTVSAVFTVTLSAASGQTVTVNYATADGTATQPLDYTSASGTLTFAPGVTTQTIAVLVNGETVPEANETFFVNLSGATNATIADNQGVGTITNDDVPVTVNPPTLPNGAVAAAYGQTVTASGGVAPYTFAVTAGALPAGLTLAPGGTLSGTPTAGGTFNFTITATDSSPFPGPFSGNRAYSLVISPPTVTLPATALPGGTLGAAYSATINPASGGTAPYTYAVTAGALPAGLTLNASTGAITGTPSALGTFNFAIIATDSSTGTGPYNSAPRGYALTVIDVPPTAANSSLTVAYNAGATNVPLTLGGGATTSVVIGTAPSNGTATVTGPNTISYQPTAGYAGPDSFTYTATNSGGTSAPATVTVTVSNPVVTITPAGGFAATVASPYTQSFTFNGGAQPWSGYQVTNLPAGVSITGTTANTVTISGTPTQAGSFNLNVSATDSSTGNGPYTVGQVFALTVAGPTLTMSPAAGTLTVPYAAPYSQTFVASGGTGPYTYALTGTLPAGLSFSGDTLSGTATEAGTFNVSVTATDTGTTGTGAPFTVTNNYTIAIGAPTIDVQPMTLPDPVAGTAYSETITATGGAGTMTFAVTAGTLPDGLTLSGAGALSGTPTEVGTFNVTITATDENGYDGARAYTITIAAPVLTMTPPAGTLTATYGAAYSQAFTATGGSGNFSYVQTGTLPPGLAFTGNTVSGTPTAPGSYAITITATDTVLTGAGAPFSIAQNYTIDVPAPTIALTPATLPDADAGVAYSETITASGGVAPYTYTLSAGSLPAGLSVSATGTLAGTTYEVGSFSFSVTATDANGQTGIQAYTIDVTAVPLTMTPAPGTLTATYGAAYSQAFTAAGGSGAFTYSLTGTLPAGVTFSGNTLSGTPTVPGSYAISVTATDTQLTGAGSPFSITQAYTLDVPAPTIVVDPATVPDVAAGVAYSQAITASGGVGPYSFAVTAGTLPAGITLSSSGSLSGTSFEVGTFTFTVTATDANGQNGAQAYTVDVTAAALAMTPAAGTLTATYGVAYSQAFTATGGSGSFTYTLTGALPAGVTFSGNTLSGTPTVPGSYAISVTATDTQLTGAGSPFTITQAYTLDVPAPTIVVDPATLPAVTAGVAYSQAITASGGVGPYGFTVTAGALPAGLTLSSTGTLAGTPTTSGTFNFTVTATDANGQTGTRAYTLTVNVPTLTLTPAAVPAGTAGTAYSQAFTASGGIGPYTYTLTGTLPAGVTFAGNTLSGTPTVAGTFTFSVTATDSTAGTPATITQNYSLVINAPTLVLSPTTVPSAIQNTPYSVTLSTTGGTAPYAYTVTTGTLPPGLTLTTAGVLAGTPTTAGTYAFTVTSTDTYGFTTSRAFTLLVQDRPDPSQDPEVRGLLEAQAESTRRFATAQINNFQQRLERLHRGGGAGASNGLTFSMEPNCPERVLLSIVGDRCGPNDANTVGAGMGAGAGGPAGTAQGGTSPLGFWTAGAIRSGSQDGRNGTDTIDFETDGVSAGGDYRVNDEFVFGGGLGYGTDQNDIGDQGSRAKGRAVTAALYASWHPGESFFLDGLLGYQRLSIDLRRYLTGPGGFVTGERDGKQWFASLSAGADIARDNMQFTPYVRIDAARATLDGYAERGHPFLALRYGDMDVDTLTGNIGMRLDFNHATTWGSITPRVRLEYQHEFQDNTSGTMQYADLPGGLVYRTDLVGFDRNRFVVGLGILFSTNDDLSVGLEYRGLVGSDDRDNGLMLNIEKSY